jgi:TRAP-type C4-dicarboxylate transport system permease small subunit
MKQFAVFVQSISRSLDFIAGFCIVATMAVVVLNIVLRAFLGKPLLGTMDYVTMLMALTIGLGLAYCGFKNGHIAVDLIIEKLSNKTQAIIDTFTNLIALIFWGVSSWYMVGYARTMAETNLVSPTTQIPLYPLIYLISLGLMVLCLVLVLKISDTVRQVTK